uniref:Uncharacterized protein n=1 Tax=Anopheles coluzzii TaxID=1518534 RepID=A0A8W7P786_ANOCL
MVLLLANKHNQVLGRVQYATLLVNRASALCDNGTAMLGVVVELVLAMMAPGPPSPEPENLRGSLSSLASGSISSRIGRVVEDTLGEMKSRVIEGSERERKGKPSDLRLKR